MSIGVGIKMASAHYRGQRIVLFVAQVPYQLGLSARSISAFLSCLKVCRLRQVLGLLIV